MELTSELVDHLAHLSRLHFADEAKKEIQNDLQKMLAFVEKLSELNTDGVQPMLHMGQSFNVLREDEVKGSVDRRTALQNAPGASDSFFRVPTVIRK
ncbi:MAG TPA: Asp-tRNA(Asn)/Glu-tRNA(Gln) amidotransferase GatCAB subunit C [Chitinophagaceae bacterium]|jgi:aspartyl-tRNA(Asn)/glutamyl-tRNA(Gln) amidotransferase subunit C|nr:Asp-tRNA(Asn)/Glu-tRNA(Gln) amidotransferase GatCAB subunit C [Chitinophagaceae bacterium]